MWSQKKQLADEMLSSKEWSDARPAITGWTRVGEKEQKGLCGRKQNCFKTQRSTGLKVEAIKPFTSDTLC